MKERQPLCPCSILLIPGASSHLNKLFIAVPILFVILGGLLSTR